MSLLSVDPKNGVELQRYPIYSPTRIEHSLAQASAAQRYWQAQSLQSRAAALLAVAEQLRESKAELAALISQEMGKLLSEAEQEIDRSIELCHFYASNGPEWLGPEFPDVGALHAEVQLQPLGVVLAVMPWNFPFWQVLRCAIPAWLSGNAVVLKHAGNVTGCALALAGLSERAGLPAGMLQPLLVTASQVEAVLADSRINALSFTGSVEVGRALASQAGRYGKRCVLELGGADAFVVLADADIEAAAEALIRARFRNAGQSCTAAKRVIVDGSVYEEFASRVTSLAQQLKMGDPADSRTQLGPMARADIRDKLHHQVQAAIAAGAVALAGGELPTREGWFYPATVLSQITADMRVWQEETFGPVAVIHRVAGADQAIAAANNSDFGLNASVWGEDIDRARKVANKMECGTVYVNSPVRSDVRLPFGGTKASGYGRELGRYGLMEFVSTRTVCVA